MKAALFPQKGEVVYTDLQTPRPQEGQALIEVRYAGICGSDVHVWRGAHATATYPRVPGHEFVGILREIRGKSPHGAGVGDVVVAQPYASCGVCDPCTRGMSNVCRELSILGIHQDGGFAQYVLAPLDKVYPLPPGIDLRVAALTEPLAVAVHDVRVSGFQTGQRALVIGGGPIGVLMALVIRLSGATLVTVSEVNQSRLDFLKTLGFATVNPAEEDLRAYTDRQTLGKGFDVVYEVSGSRAGVEIMTEVVKIGGTVMSIGMTAEKIPVDTGAMFYKELSLKGVRLHSQQAFSDAVGMIAAGTLGCQLESLVDKVFPLERIADAMRYQVEDQEHFKVLIQVS